MPHSYSRILLHIVFATKRRYPFIKEHLEEGLYRYIIGTAKNLGGNVIEIGGIEDHIHILTGLKTTVAPAKFLQSLKPSVTLWAKENVHRGFSWQDGYGAFSVSDSDTGRVRRYIQNQKEHHKNVDFETEFIQLCEENGVEVDVEFLWK